MAAAVLAKGLEGAGDDACGEKVGGALAEVLAVVVGTGSRGFSDGFADEEVKGAGVLEEEGGEEVVLG
jgi:hypothetical protein